MGRVAVWTIICAKKSDRKGYMNEIDGLLVLLSFPKPKANRSKKRRQFHDLFTFEGSCLIKTIHSYKTAWSTSGICSMFFAREENAITRKSQSQKQRPSTRRNKALQKRRQKYKASKKERDNQSHVSRKENDKAKTVWKTDVSCSACTVVILHPTLLALSFSDLLAVLTLELCKTNPKIEDLAHHRAAKFTKNKNDQWNHAGGAGLSSKMPSRNNWLNCRARCMGSEPPKCRRPHASGILRVRIWKG